MSDRGQTKTGGSSRYPTSSIPEDEVEDKINEVVVSTIRDLKEINRKSNVQLPRIVDIFVAKMMERLGVQE